MHHLQEALHASGDTAEQARLIAGLGECRNPGLAPHLEPFVRHEDRDVRRETVRALAVISRTSLEHTLLTALESPNDEVRADAAAAIGERGVYLAVPALINLIRKTSVLAAEPSELVQARACQALGQLREQGSVPALLAAVSRGAVGMLTKPPLVRSAAAMALSQLADGPQRDPITRALEQACEDDEGVVRAAALVALGRVSRQAISASSGR